MILDRIENAHLYFAMDSALLRAVTFARDAAAALPDGRHGVEGEALLAIVETYETRPAASRRFEAHRRCCDVQVMLEGCERHDVTQVPDAMADGAYDARKDVAFFKTPAQFSTVHLTPGFFVVYHPQDLHRPSCAVDDRPTRVRKVCMKVVGDTGLEPVTSAMSRRRSSQLS